MSSRWQKRKSYYSYKCK